MVELISSTAGLAKVSETPSITNDIDTGDLLFKWLGSFWSGICEDAELLNRMYKANGVLSAQLYQEFLDSINLANRKQIPLYHRKAWYPITLYLKDKNSSDACGLKLNMDPTPVIGAQTDTLFEVGAICKIGGSLPYKNITAYALPDTIKSLATITDNIVSPNVVYLSGVNYVIQDSILYFLNNQDPFDNAQFISEDVEIDDVTTKKIILWCAETLIDRDYIYNHAGYVLGFKDATSKEYLTAVNALWDTYNDGATVANLKIAMASILGEPIATSAVEVVDTVINLENTKQVITDRNVYTLNSRAEIHSDVTKGAILHRGDFLTSTIRLYDNLDPTRLQANSPDVQQLREDVPALFLPAPMFRAKLDGGIGVTWELTDIINAGQDANDNTKYTFKVYGSDSDISKLWADIQDYMTQNDVAFGDVLTGYLYEDADIATPEGTICGRIASLEFFMANCLKSNAFITVIDVSSLSDFGARNLYKLKELKKITPAHVYMFTIEKITDLTDDYALDTGLSESIIQSVAKPENSVAKAGGRSAEFLTYSDKLVRVKWVPVCSK